MQKLTMMRPSSTLSVIIPPQSHKDIKEKNELSLITFVTQVLNLNMEAGFDSYMSKPIKVREFLKTVDDFFQSS